MRGWDQVNGDRLAWIFRLQGRDVTFYAVNQLLICRPVVGTTGVGGIVSVAGCRGARVEVTCTRKGLADDTRTHYHAIFGNQLAVGLVLEGDLSQQCNSQGITNSQNDSCDYGIENRYNKVLFHNSSAQANPIAPMITSMILIPTKGTMIPPTP